MFKKDKAIIALIVICISSLVGFVLFQLATHQQQLAQQVARLRELNAPTPFKLAESKAETVVSEDVDKNAGEWIEVQRALKDSVVQVFAQIAKFNWLEPYKTPEQGGGCGSGFFVSDEGHIVTNFHVINEASGIDVQIPSLGKRQFQVNVVGVSPDRDLALLQLCEKDLAYVREVLGKIPYLAFGNSDEVVRGHEVLALGFPLGGQTLKSTQGIVSGRERIPELPFAFIQTTAPLNPGNSGGPSVNRAGEVIGINSAGSAWVGAQNVGYIIPTNEIQTALKDLYRCGGVLHKPLLNGRGVVLHKPMLGGIFLPSMPHLARMLGNPGEGGWYVVRVFKDSLIERAGVQEGDMIYQVNGYQVDSFGEIAAPWQEDKVSVLELLNRFEIGDTIRFGLYRKGEHKEIEFALEKTALPAVRMMYPEYEKVDYEVFGGLVVMDLSMNHIGMMVNRAPHLVAYSEPEKQFEPALILTHVLPNSQAQKTRSLCPGVLIKEVNDIPVKTVEDFRAAVAKSKHAEYLTLRVMDRMVDRMLVVLPLQKIIQEEPMLAMRFFYEPSKLTRLFDEPSSLPRVAERELVDMSQSLV